MGKKLEPIDKLWNKLKRAQASADKAQQENNKKGLKEKLGKVLVLQSEIDLYYNMVPYND